MAGLPHGVLGGMPVGDLPSPPPCGWSRGFMTTPRTSGRWPMCRARPALPRFWFSWSRLPTWPTVAMQRMLDAPDLAGRQSDLGVRRPPWPAAGPRRPRERTIWPPLPGTSSMLWIVVPSGMCASGRALPTRASASGPATTTSPTRRPVGHEHVALLAVAVVEQADARRAVGVVLDRREARGHAELVALEVDAPVVRASRRRRDGARSGGPALFRPDAALLRLEQRLVRLVGRDLLEGRARHEPRRPGEVGL